MAITHIEGDCLQVMPSLPRQSFDLLLTDPPYAMPATYYQGRHSTRKWSDTSIMQSWWRLVTSTYLPLLKINGMAIVFVNADAMAAFWPIMYERMSLQMAVWNKRTIGMGQPLRNQCEFMIVGSVGKAYASNLGQGNIFDCPRVHSGERVHPAQKPTLLIEELINLFCPPGGAVLDPFAGSAVVASVCESTGRSCTSIEWDASEHNMPQPLLLSTNGVHE